LESKIPIIAALFVISLSLLSCGGERSTGPGDGGGAVNTPSGVVASLEQAINNFNDVGYRALMHDSMTFYFDDDDVGDEVNGYTIPESWPLGIDYPEVKSFLANAYSINCEIDEDAVGTPAMESEAYSSPPVTFVLTWYYSS
jgi:hypothetical protein